MYFSEYIRSRRNEDSTIGFFCMQCDKDQKFPYNANYALVIRYLASIDIPEKYFDLLELIYNQYQRYI